VTIGELLARLDHGAGCLERRGPAAEAGANVYGATRTKTCPLPVRLGATRPVSKDFEPQPEPIGYERKNGRRVQQSADALLRDPTSARELDQLSTTADLRGAVRAIPSRTAARRLRIRGVSNAGHFADVDGARVQDDVWGVRRLVDADDADRVISMDERPRLKRWERIDPASKLGANLVYERGRAVLTLRRRVLPAGNYLPPVDTDEEPATGRIVKRGNRLNELNDSSFPIPFLCSTNSVSSKPSMRSMSSGSRSASAPLAKDPRATPLKVMRPEDDASSGTPLTPGGKSL
jgi:hypothetical protein